jgi:hypothetical protein
MFREENSSFASLIVLLYKYVSRNNSSAHLIGNISPPVSQSRDITMHSFRVKSKKETLVAGLGYHKDVGHSGSTSKSSLR